MWWTQEGEFLLLHIGYMAIAAIAVICDRNSVDQRMCFYKYIWRLDILGLNLKVLTEAKSWYLMRRRKDQWVIWYHDFASVSTLRFNPNILVC